MYLSDCDEAIERICSINGWSDELENLVKKDNQRRKINRRQMRKYKQTHKKYSRKHADSLKEEEEEEDDKGSSHSHSSVLENDGEEYEVTPKSEIQQTPSASVAETSSTLPLKRKHKIYQPVTEQTRKEAEMIHSSDTKKNI